MSSDKNNQVSPLILNLKYFYQPENRVIWFGSRFYLARPWVERTVYGFTLRDLFEDVASVEERIGDIILETPVRVNMQGHMSETGAEHLTSEEALIIRNMILALRRILQRPPLQITIRCSIGNTEFSMSLRNRMALNDLIQIFQESDYTRYVNEDNYEDLEYYQESERPNAMNDFITIIMGLSYFRFRRRMSF